MAPQQPSTGPRPRPAGAARLCTACTCAASRAMLRPRRRARAARGCAGGEALPNGAQNEVGGCLQACRGGVAGGRAPSCCKPAAPGCPVPPSRPQLKGPLRPLLRRLHACPTRVCESASFCCWNRQQARLEQPGQLPPPAALPPMQAASVYTGLLLRFCGSSSRRLPAAACPLLLAVPPSTSAALPAILLVVAVAHSLLAAASSLLLFWACAAAAGVLPR